MKKILIAALLCGAPALADTVDGLRTPDEFAGIESEADRSVALFEEMLVVIEHPRCMNCHPVDNSPRQGMQMQMHQPPVVRGVADFGAPGMRCTTCHGSENVAFATGSGSIPGHSPWQLAPLSMGWIGKSAAEICAQLKDPERNGGKTLADLHEHNAEDGLVGWGWHPGDGREPVPGTQEIFGQLTQAWIDTGAACPAG
ncbi:Isoquinoline 1-oxidoreductase subunit [Citreicella sp. C3M06]|uniref:Isoquinoline 1-oxidoreductase subunit n=1 Tax=Roseobacteraceae TaxID=2854170 RepID=UPI001C081D4F|nr:MULTISPECIES: Isoquinoline 1-oxidoreductase subunit [Roseobacteraceae]MBU2961210.1 Isoquinoline 1-oxidoreductase subunit [Citreicella sp. C3M06]MDO6585051.1 Isoquinoline 1-oxidoreductase subunit [Salipiger sp. 1_MG-2023]